MPFGHGRHFRSNASKPLDLVFGGWQLGGILNARSGVPIDVLIQRPDIAYVDTRNGNVYQNPVFTKGVLVSKAVVNVRGGGNTRNVRRPNVVAGVDPILVKRRTRLYQSGCLLGSDSRNLRQFGTQLAGGSSLAQLDLTLSKKFKVTERASIELRGEAYNITNHANFAKPGNVRLNTGLPTGTTAAGIQPGSRSHQLQQAEPSV